MVRKVFCLVSLTLLIGLTTAAPAAADLLAWWTFNEAAGTTAADVSGNGHDGTLNGDASWAAGHLGGALQLDGSGDYVMCGLLDIDTTVTGGMTVTAWINKPAGGDYKTCSNRQGENAAGGGFTCSIYNDRMEMDICSATARNLNRDSDGPTIPGDTWIHLAWVFDDAGDMFHEYHNGVLVDSSSEAVSVGLSTQNFRVGADSPTLGNYFSGMIDDLRVYSHVLTEAELADVMAGKAPGFETAGDPKPESGATDVPRDAVLSWSAGEFAATHDVYLGTVFDDVDAADRVNPMAVLVSQGQPETSYVPAEVLQFGQTYYWRIDEVNAAPDNTVFKGEVWSFTTEPLVYPIQGVVATSNATSGADAGPENTVDGSGLNAADEHSLASEDAWLATWDASEPLWIQFEFDAVHKLHQMFVWNYNSQFEMVLGFGLKDVTVEYSTDGDEWTAFGDVQLARAAATATYTFNTTIDLEGVVARYVRLVVNSGWGTMGQYGLSEVRFTYLPVLAREPEPADGAVDVSVEALLTWRAGREAVSHEVLLGTDPETLAVVDAVAASQYGPGTLDLGTTYYWRIDEVNENAAPSLWTGNIWSFSTQDYLVVDDFESYTNDLDGGNAIFQAWTDGYEDTANGSQVGYLDAPFAEQAIVRGGSQSMPLYFDNTSASTSVADLDLGGQDWTQAGIQTLVLYFRGGTSNTGGRLYLKINGTKVIHDGDDDALTKPRWGQWNVDLASVGINLGNVTSLSVGVDGGGSGLVYIDDILLYRTAPEILAPVDPGTDGLMLQYLFDSGATDSSGNGYHGSLLGDAGAADGVLNLDGADDAVAVPRIGGASATFSAFSYAMWVNPASSIADVQFAGGLNTDVWAAGAAHFKLSYGLVNVGINGLDGGDLAGVTMVNAGEWSHMALTVSPTRAAIYLNGQIEDSRDLAAPMTNLILGGASLGAWNNGGTLEREMTGQMDDVRIYDRALSEAEILFLAENR